MTHNINSIKGLDRHRSSGEGLWSEANARRLLQAAVPTREPDPELLARVERRLVETAFAERPTRAFRFSVPAAAMAYAGLLALAALAGLQLRPTPTMEMGSAVRSAPHIDYARPPITGASVVSVAPTMAVRRQSADGTKSAVGLPGGIGTPAPPVPNGLPARKDRP